MSITHVVTVLYNCYRGPTPNGRYLTRALGACGAVRAEFARERLPLFQKFVLPSLRGQISRRFHLLVLLDDAVGIPDVRERLRAAMDGIGLTQHLVAIPAIDFRQDYDNAFWRARSGEDAVLGELCVDAKSLYVTYLDSDDMLRDDYVARVQDARVGRDTQVILVPNGYVLDSRRRRLAACWYRSPPFYTLTYSTQEYFAGHRHHGGRGRHIEVAARLRAVTVNERLYMQHIHGGNDSSRFPRNAARVGPGEAESILRRFGVQTQPRVDESSPG